jgi:hypothetical protein
MAFDWAVADEIAEDLRKAMPHDSEIVNHDIDVGESELAIPDTLAVFSQVHQPLTAALRSRVEELAESPGIWDKFARAIREELAGIPVAGTPVLR